MIASWRPDPPGLTAGRIGHNANFTLNVTGTLSPDVTGIYLYDGLYLANQSWKHQTLASYIWKPTMGSDWFISGAKGDQATNAWESVATPPPSWFLPVSPSTGIAKILTVN